MDWNSAVNKGCFRYVVPFTFDISFEEAAALTEKQMDPDGRMKSVWTRRIVSRDKRESDLYDYIRNEARVGEAAGDIPEEKIGCEWLHRSSEELKQRDGMKILELLYFETPAVSGDKELPLSLNISVTNLGLVLYRNHLGFIWYELALPLNDMNTLQLVFFQNRIREMNRGANGDRNAFLWKKCRGIPAYGIAVEDKKHDISAQGIAAEKGRYGRKRYIEPFMFGTWIAELTGFLGVRFIAERYSVYKKVVMGAMASISSIPGEKRTFDEEQLVRQAKQNLFGNPDFETDKRRESVLKGEVRRLKADLIPADHKFVPDKALLFTYGSFRCEDAAGWPMEDRYPLAYWIANGYAPSYRFSEDRKQQMVRPFSNVLWYATQEGTAYLVWPDEDNERFYNSTMLSKIRGDYFTMYLKILYQSYSLLLYAQKIQNDISAKNGGHLKEGADEKITEIYEEINLFLTKSMATSVSHIDHQSGFYNYLKKQLRIQEDVASVTAGLNALDSLKREQKQREETARLQAEWLKERERDHQAAEAERKREERERQAEEAEKRRDNVLQLFLALFGLIGIASALLDGYQFIVELNRGSISGNMALNLGIFFAVITVIGIVTLVAVVIAFINSWKK